MDTETGETDQWRSFSIQDCGHWKGDTGLFLVNRFKHHHHKIAGPHTAHATLCLAS